MCEAHAYLVKAGKEEKVLESVDLVECCGEEIRLVSIFGEQKTLRGRLKAYDGGTGKILIETS
jgi:predicted RNA-binding protein